MIAVQLLASQPLVERVGWALVHFLWQGVLISAVYAAIRHGLGRSSSPNTRYILACGVLAIMMVLPFVTMAMLRPADPISDSSRLNGLNPTSFTSLTSNAPASVRATVSNVRPRQWLPWVVTLWLAGAVAFGIRLIGGWAFAARIRSTQVRPASWEWQQTLARLGARIGLTRRVRLLVSAMVQVPTVIGWLRPVVLVPIGALAGLPLEHMEALLVHELAHIRRNDYLVNIIQSIGEALLFYHPAIWWVSGHIRMERELCCDDTAVSVTGDALMYACALAELESFRPAHFKAAVAANGGSLAGRIGRLLGHPRPAARTLSGQGIVISGVLIVVLAYGRVGQTTPLPRFAFVSINANAAKGSDVQGARDYRAYPDGRLSAEKALLAFLIQKAYGVESFQIGEGPDWMSSAHYDVDAAPKGTANPEQSLLMLQSLLEDRFRLIVHRETRDLPVLVLTAAAGGPKLQPPGRGSCLPLLSGQLSHMTTPLCGRFFLTLNSVSKAHLVAVTVSMTDLTRYLSTLLGVTVIDKTGYAGTFDAQLNFRPDEALALIRGSVRPPRAAGNEPDSIFTAMQEQLGLKLESSKGPVEMIVIDHAEKPGVRLVSDTYDRNR